MILSMLSLLPIFSLTCLANRRSMSQLSCSEWFVDKLSIVSDSRLLPSFTPDVSLKYVFMVNSYYVSSDVCMLLSVFNTCYVPIMLLVDYVSRVKQLMSFVVMHYHYDHHYYYVYHDFC